MKYIDEYREAKAVRQFAAAIQHITTREWTLNALYTLINCSCIHVGCLTFFDHQRNQRRTRRKFHLVQIQTLAASIGGKCGAPPQNPSFPECPLHYVHSELIKVAINEMQTTESSHKPIYSAIQKLSSQHVSQINQLQHFQHEGCHF